MRRRERERLTLRLEPELVDILKRMKARRNLSLNEVVAQVVRAKLTESVEDSSSSLRRHVATISATQEDQQEQLSFVREQLRLFIFAWFASNPRPPEDKRAAAAEDAEERLTRFEEEIMRRLRATGGTVGAMQPIQREGLGE